MFNQLNLEIKASLWYVKDTWKQFKTPKTNHLCVFHQFFYISSLPSPYILPTRILFSRKMEIHSVYCLLSLFRRRDKTLSGIQYKIGILSIESIFQQTNLLQWHLFSRIHIGVEIKPVARLFSYRCCGYITSIVTGVSLASKRLPLSGACLLVCLFICLFVWCI